MAKKAQGGTCCPLCAGGPGRMAGGQDLLVLLLAEAGACLPELLPACMGMDPRASKASSGLGTAPRACGVTVGLGAGVVLGVSTDIVAAPGSAAGRRDGSVGQQLRACEQAWSVPASAKSAVSGLQGGAFRCWQGNHLRDSSLPCACPAMLSLARVPGRRLVQRDDHLKGATASFQARMYRPYPGSRPRRARHSTRSAAVSAGPAVAILSSHACHTAPLSCAARTRS